MFDSTEWDPPQPAVTPSLPLITPPPSSLPARCGHKIQTLLSKTKIAFIHIQLSEENTWITSLRGFAKEISYENQVSKNLHDDDRLSIPRNHRVNLNWIVKCCLHSPLAIVISWLSQYLLCQKGPNVREKRNRHRNGGSTEEHWLNERKFKSSTVAAAAVCQ